jgi:hypothetical protein
MAADQLVGDRLDRLGDGKVPLVVFELGDEDRFEQEIAELLSEGLVRAGRWRRNFVSSAYV